MTSKIMLNTLDIRGDKALNSFPPVLFNHMLYPRLNRTILLTSYICPLCIKLLIVVSSKVLGVWHIFIIDISII